MKTRFRIAFILLVALLATGCSGLHGWGVVLWSFDASAGSAADTNAGTGSPDAAAKTVPSGTIVPIMIKSNINHVYVVRVPGTKENVEVALWRLEYFKDKAKALRYAEAFAPLAGAYGLTLRDGLALRDEATNLAKQVYRLRLSEPVKLLKKVDGQEVVTGGKKLPGDWYLALAQDGTRGYVFSNQLKLWDDTKEARPAIASDAAASDQASQLFGKTWRPDYYATMVESEKIDLARFDLRFGLFTDAVRKTIRVEVPGASRVIAYEEIKRQKNGSWRFDDQPVTLVFNGVDRATVTFEKEAAPNAYAFSLFDGDIRAIVQAEELRRLTALAGIVRAAPCAAPDGTRLELAKSGSFTVKAAGAQAALPPGAGQLAIDLFASDALADAWEGGLTFRYEGAATAPRFLYRVEGSTLTLGPLDDGMLSGAIAVKAPASTIEFRATGD